MSYMVAQKKKQIDSYIENDDTHSEYKFIVGWTEPGTLVIYHDAKEVALVEYAIYAYDSWDLVDFVCDYPDYECDVQIPFFSEEDSCVLTDNEVVNTQNKFLNEDQQKDKDSVYEAVVYAAYSKSGFSKDLADCKITLLKTK